MAISTLFQTEKIVLAFSFPRYFLGKLLCPQGFQEQDKSLLADHILILEKGIFIYRKRYAEISCSGIISRKVIFYEEIKSFVKYVSWDQVKTISYKKTRIQNFRVVSIKISYCDVDFLVSKNFLKIIQEEFSNRKKKK
eukprot:snap_masked-scaffold_6-processed-gene-19.15-mRNA-1 protein AED:1.00 eAED:1.00 QI:0/0/0/0/1/1/2/0/137